MKLFISFLIAVAIVVLAIALLLIGKKLAYKYGDDFVGACITVCVIIACIMAYIYSLW